VNQHDDIRRDDLPADCDAAERARAERWSEVIDAYVRGHLDGAGREELLSAAKGDPELWQMLDDARAVRERFSTLPSLEAPASLDQRILAAVDATPANASRSVRRSKSPRPARRPWLWSWGTAVAAVLVFVFLGGPSLLIHTPSDPDSVVVDGVRYARADVEAARAQLELAFTVFDNTMHRSASIVRSEMQSEVGDRVTQPLRQGFGRTLRSIPYLDSRRSNEEHSLISTPPTGEC